jgi:hypothetical protein
MTIHVITAFSRPQNLPALLPMLESQWIVWHPICHEPVDFGSLPWIEPFSVGPVPADTDPCYWKLNQWLESHEIDDGSIYCFLCDDDCYDAGFFDFVRQSRFDDALVVSARFDPHKILVAHPDNMQVCKINLTQYLLRGHVARKLRFENSGVADGLAAQWLAANYRCTFRPDLFVVLNLLRPGVWSP